MRTQNRYGLTLHRYDTLHNILIPIRLLLLLSLFFFFTSIYYGPPADFLYHFHRCLYYFNNGVSGRGVGHNSPVPRRRLTSRIIVDVKQLCCFRANDVNTRPRYYYNSIIYIMRRLYTYYTRRTRTCIPACGYNGPWLCDFFFFFIFFTCSGISRRVYVHFFIIIIFFHGSKIMSRDLSAYALLYSVLYLCTL